MTRCMALVLGAVLLAGCSSIHMQHPDGRRVECAMPLYCVACADHVMSQCVQDYKEQGFVRVPQ